MKPKGGGKWPESMKPEMKPTEGGPHYPMGGDKYPTEVLKTLPV